MDDNKTQAEREDVVKMHRNVVMGMEILNCSVCSDPLRPKVFQCSCGHFICKRCNSMKPKEMCHACSGPFSQRAFGMERVLANVLVPCDHDDCTEITSWFKINLHEVYCLHGPAVCPADGCELEAPKAALLGHMSAVHEWPATSFRYGAQFALPAVPGSRLLRGNDDDQDHVFLLTMSDSLSNGHRAVYIQPVGYCDPQYDFGCAVSVTWEDCFGRNQHRSGSCDDILFRDGEKDCLCIFPGHSDFVLKTIISKKANLELDTNADKRKKI